MKFVSMLCHSQAPVSLRRIFRIAVLSGVLALAAEAQESGTGSISGRVLNPVSREYLARAEVTASSTGAVVFTDNNGKYTLSRLPAGPVTVTVSYTGFSTAMAVVNVAAGSSVNQDFNLSPSEVIKMDEFSVSAPVIGDAKAIMDQRASLNFRNVIASDSFGENPDGNMGEFLKLLPGVTIDYAFIQARGMRLGGMDPKYTSMTVDGIALSSAGTAAFGGGSRAVEMDAFSISGIEAVELNKTATADMEATAVSGNVNFRSKKAFEREGRLFAYNFSVTANEYAMDFDKTPGWKQETQRKITPNWTLGYADIFFNQRLGIQLNYSDSTRWSPRDVQILNYDFSQMATRGPLINQLAFGDEAVMVRGTTVGLNADFKATEHLVVSVRTNYSQRSLPGLRRIFRLFSTPATMLPESSLTKIVTTPSGTNSRIEFVSDVLNEKLTSTETHAIVLNYKRDFYDLTGGFDYSRGIAEYVDVSKGYFTLAASRLSSMSWRAERSDPFSTDWTVTQLSGRPWNNPANWNLDSAIANNIGSREREGTTEKMSGYLDAIFQVDARFPIKLKAGLKSRDVRFKLRGVGAQNWSYVGPTGSQTSPSARIPTEQLIYRNDDSMHGSGVPFSDWPRPDRELLYQIYRANPEYFTENAVTNFREKLIYPRTVEETINSAYVDATSEIGNLRLRLGARFEDTETTGWRVEQRTASAITAARPDLVPNTIPYVTYQFYNGDQRRTTGSYNNLFLSGGAKYRVRKNLDAQVSFSDGILRPDYNNIAGTIVVDETNRIVTAPNTSLRPELSTKYYAGFSTYFEPAGALSAGVYLMRIEDLQTPGRSITQAEAGYSDYPEYNNYEFRTAYNMAGRQETRGFEIDYRQQLVFLPGILQALSVYASYSRVLADADRIGVVGKSGSGGLNFRYKNLSARLNGTWQAPMVTGLATAPTRKNYRDDRYSIDAEFSFKIYRNTAVYLNGRNINDAPFKTYTEISDTGQRLLLEDARYGAFWTVGVKGTF